jgi:hypothetical protein
VESGLGAVGGKRGLRLFCDEFVKAVSARGGDGHAFVGAAALWIGLKAVGGGGGSGGGGGGGGGCDALDLAAEIAMAGDASGVIASLRWLDGRVAGPCGANVREMMTRRAAAFAGHFFDSCRNIVTCIVLEDPLNCMAQMSPCRC